MALTDDEKKVGKLFRAQSVEKLDEINEIDPPTYEVPFFLGIYRHLCSARHGRSTGMELKEKYLLSPMYPDDGVPAGRFGFVFREGRCRACGQTARSRVGRIVDGWERPPLTGRVARS